MSHILSPPPRMGWITALASMVSLCGSAFAQNFTMQVTDPDPLGLGSFVPSIEDLGLGLEGKIKGAFVYGLKADTFYNSNFFLTESGEKSEVYEVLTPWLTYISDPEGGAKATFTANYTPAIRLYEHNSDLNGMDQSGDATLTFHGARTQVDLFGRYNAYSATDRLTGDYVEGSVMTGGFRLNRQVAPRTSANAGWSVAVSDFGSSANEGAEVHTTYLGGYWEASPRLSFGPTVRYTMTTSDNTGTRDAWALLLDARYRLGERLWFSASLGPEYSRNSDTGSDQSSVSLTGNLNATYVINELWTWTGIVREAAVPSPVETNYMINNLLISTALNRQLTRSSVSGGLEFNFSNYEDVGPVTTVRGNEENLGVFLGYRRNLFSDRVFFDSMVRYTINSGQTDWSQFIVSAGLNVAF